MISVVIPVFRAKDFIGTAVESATSHPIVQEILLIYDGSADGTFEICEVISQENEKVRLFSHKDRINKGAGASRNLGIEMAKFPYVAFLDADDYFLPCRFQYFEDFFNRDSEFDGIYEAIQYFNGSNKIYTISKSIPFRKLFHFLLRGTYGHFHTNGLIVKKELLLRAGLFDESLDLHQDSDLWIKLAFYGKLIPGDLNNPVAMVRKHDGNRIWKGTSNTSRFKQWKVTWEWSKKESIGIINRLLILRKLIKYKIRSLKEQ